MLWERPRDLSRVIDALTADATLPARLMAIGLPQSDIHWEAGLSPWQEHASTRSVLKQIA